MISGFNVHLSNYSYTIEEQLKKRNLTDDCVINLEQFIGADRQRQIRVWYRDSRTTEERDNDIY
jgi:hypothetical protein